LRDNPDFDPGEVETDKFGFKAITLLVVNFPYYWPRKKKREGKKRKKKEKGKGKKGERKGKGREE
jgi:hypothetical protein